MTGDPLPTRTATGFILLPVVLTLVLIASVSLIASRDSGTHAAMLAEQDDQLNARYIAEAGLQHANQLVQQRGCLGPFPLVGSAPVVNAAFAGGSYTAFADRSSGSPVLLTATGSYKGATVTMTRPNTLVYQSAVQTFTLQPDSVDARDTYVTPSTPTSNFGGDSTLRLAIGSHQPLLRFDFAGLPPGSRPVALYNSGTASLGSGAMMSLYQTQSAIGTGSVGAHLINRGWAAGTGVGSVGGGATWNTSDGTTVWPSPGNGYALSSLSNMASLLSIGWQNWDLTDAANAWLSGTTPNHGVWMVGSGTTLGQFRYVSADEARNLTRRPKMAMTYLLPCGLTAPTRVVLDASRDTEIDSSSPNADRGNNDHMMVSATRIRRALIHFSTASIPAGRTIVSATLRLYADNTSPNPLTTPVGISVSALISQAWTSDASWNNFTGNSSTANKAWQPAAGGTFRPAPVTTRVVPAGFAENNWVEFDLSGVVREWVDGVTPNLGVILQSTAPNSHELDFSTLNDIADEEEPGTNKVPQLVVVYR